MKKKISVILAAVMSLSPISVFAASSNEVSKQVSASIGKTLFMEEGWGGSVTNLKASNSKTDKIEYVVDGSTLFIKPTTGNIKIGDTFKLSLDNASWFFRHNTSDDAATSMSFASTDKQALALKKFIANNGVVKSTDTSVTTVPFPNVITLSPTGLSSGINRAWFDQIAKFYLDETILANLDTTINGDILTTNADLTAGTHSSVATPVDLATLFAGTNAFNLPLSTTDFTEKNMISKIAEVTGSNPNFSSRLNEVSTYSMENGIYFPNSSTYVKCNNFTSGSGNQGAMPGVGEENIAYTLTVSTSDPSIATVTFYSDFLVSAFATGDKGIPFPLTSLSKTEGDVRVRVASDSNHTTISASTHQYALTSSTNTTTSVSEKVNSKFNFPLKSINIKERVPYSIQQGKITLTAPYGYYFADPKVKSTREGEKDAKYPSANASEGLFFRGNETVIENEVISSGSYNVGRYIDYAYETVTGQSTISGNPDFSKPIRDKIVINTHDDAFPGLPFGSTGLGLQHSSKTNGVLYIVGLALVAQEYAPYDKDVLINIKGNGVTEEDFSVGTRKDWGIEIKTISDIPKLVSGRFTEEKASNEFDKDHKAAKIKFKENIVASWWSLRETSFTLSEGAKFIKVRIDKEKNFNHSNSHGVLNGTYRPQGERTSYVSLDSRFLKITDLDITRDKISSFEMETWLSIESGFEGDIELSLDDKNLPDELKPVVIAKSVNPITITSKVTDVKIGYQWQKVADFTIEETDAGMLKRNTTLELFIDDNITGSDNIAFAPDFITEVNSDSKILFTKPIINDGRIVFTIERFSYGKPATIKFSNIYVKIDRTVPESNKRPYAIIAGGDAIAANYNKKPGSYEPKFYTKGIGTDFINVVTSANDKDSVLSNIVRITIGSSEVLLGRNSESAVEMDTSAYISPNSNSAMVPVRFISQALGIPNNQIHWDNERRAVTIYNGARIIQFIIGSSEITINGVTTTIYSPDTIPLKVSAEIKDERAFLPLRALANSLGVSVGWDESTQTAIFNSDLLSDDEKEIIDDDKKTSKSSNTQKVTAKSIIKK